MPPQKRPSGTVHALEFARALDGAVRRRRALFSQTAVTAYRVFDGEGDGVPGVSLDRYGPAAVLNVDADADLARHDVVAYAHAALESLAPAGVETVYGKPFARDRSRLGGALPEEATSPAPLAGAAQPESLVVEEYGVRFEVRPYDGLSTGLFLEHREHRRFLAQRRPARVLNLFAYTCAFAMPLARAGSVVTNVDVSGRYLDWGRRNLALNALDSASMRFLRRDARDMLAQAVKKPEERFDLVILDPPTFAAANRRRGVEAWRAIDDYPALIAAARAVLTPEGALFVASNTRALAVPGALEQVVRWALPVEPRWLTLPPWPPDVTAPGRVAAAFVAP